MKRTRRQRTTSRMDLLIRMVPPDSRVADIGTDRGLLPHLLLRAGRASFCIASERDPLRLSRVRTPPGDPRLSKLALRAGDGLDVLSPEDGVDVVVLAGLGAHAVCRILGSPRLGASGTRRLVLQPTTDPGFLRRWLWARGWRLVDEGLVLEHHRFFTVMAAERGEEPPPGASPPLSREDLAEAGPCLVRSEDPLVRSYWRNRLAILQNVLRTARGRNRDRAVERYDLARRVLAALPRDATVSPCPLKGGALISGRAGRTPPSGCRR